MHPTAVAGGAVAGDSGLPGEDQASVLEYPASSASTQDPAAEPGAVPGDDDIPEGQVPAVVDATTVTTLPRVPAPDRQALDEDVISGCTFSTRPLPSPWSTGAPEVAVRMPVMVSDWVM